MQAALTDQDALAPGYGGQALDIDALDANTMGDAALQKELFGLYFGYAQEAMAQLSAALEKTDAKAWVAATHGLKGTARTLGLTRLADIAAEAQDAAEAGPSGVTAARFSVLHDALIEATAAAHAYLGQKMRQAS